MRKKLTKIRSPRSSYNINYMKNMMKVCFDQRAEEKKKHEMRRMSEEDDENCTKIVFLCLMRSSRPRKQKMMWFGIPGNWIMISGHNHVYDRRVQHIDYECEDGRFPVPASCVTISNPNLLSSSETGVNPGIRS
jgi:hypothetical protein